MSTRGAAGRRTLLGRTVVLLLGRPDGPASFRGLSAGPRKVTDPRGEVWTVRRRWVPRLGAESLWERFRRRFRRTRERTDLADLADPGGLDLVDGGGVLAGLALALALLLLIFVGLPLLVALLDVALVLLLALVGIVGRVLFRRPWVVEARTHHSAYRWRVRGWRASTEKVTEVQRSLAGGVIPRDGIER